MRALSEVINQILLGRCEDVLRELPDACVDAIVSDPPYGLGTKEPTGEEIDRYMRGERLDTGGDFMGHEWDIPPVSTWKECLRVVKPGGYVLAFAGTRTWDIMDLGMRCAGLTDVDTFARKFGPSMLQWIQGQGFPKSLNIFKQLQKIGVSESEAKKWEGFGTALKPSWEPILVFRREGDTFVKPELNAPFFYTGKATKKETTLNGRIENDHPTKKPVNLMRWLIGLVVPKNGLVLDPYCGSGSTCHAAIEEGCRFIGIEMDPKFHAIASKRVELVQQDYEAAHGEDSLFAMAFE